ncbi:hypothetical protein EV424DRAFT_1543667 [Suillus variegatus]|nr:hypothetical protein EV424DRAFT_1543667 [Suillus variegatus]
MSQDACALNADGSLKDAADITFFNDPDDDVPLPNVPPSTQPSTSTASTRDAYSSSTQSWTYPSNSRSRFSVVSPSLKALSSHEEYACNALAPATFSALQLLKAGYRNGHISAATEAEEFAAMLD